ncbi:MAG: hypothetical protein OSA98_18185 [Rubripirellula sp.]|nr:hypothetical protein [Rubripirellula sp.]
MSDNAEQNLWLGFQRSFDLVEIHAVFLRSKVTEAKSDYHNQGQNYSVFDGGWSSFGRQQTQPPIWFALGGLGFSLGQWPLASPGVAASPGLGLQWSAGLGLPWSAGPQGAKMALRRGGNWT